MERGTKIMNCPFCDALIIKCWMEPAHIEHHKSRGSGHTSGGYHSVSEKVTVMAGCSKCNKSKIDVQAKLNGTYNESNSNRCVWCGNLCVNGKIECAECAKIPVKKQ
jgi:hypothetical protein